VPPAAASVDASAEWRLSGCSAACPGGPLQSPFCRRRSRA